MADYAQVMTNLLNQVNQVQTTAPTLQDVAGQVKQNPFGYPDYQKMASDHAAKSDQELQTMLALQAQANNPYKKGLLDYLIPAAGLAQFALQVGKDPEAAVANLENVNKTAAGYRAQRKAEQMSGFKEQMAAMAAKKKADDENFKELMAAAKSTGEGITSTRSGVQAVNTAQGSAESRQLTKLGTTARIVSDVNKAQTQKPLTAKVIAENEARNYLDKALKLNRDPKTGVVNIPELLRIAGRVAPQHLGFIYDQLGIKDYKDPAGTLDEMRTNAEKEVWRMVKGGALPIPFASAENGVQPTVMVGTPEFSDVFKTMVENIIKTHFSVRNQPVPSDNPPMGQ